MDWGFYIVAGINAAFQIEKMARERRLERRRNEAHVPTVKLPTKTRAELAAFIRDRAIEIAADECDEVVIPLPGIHRLDEPVGIFGIHWVLADWQRAEGIGYIRVAAAEASVQWELAED